MLVNNKCQSSNYVRNNNVIPQNNINFGALKKVVCVSSIADCSEVTCFDLGKDVIRELRDLANVDRFFKENDVIACVSISYSGTEIKLRAKPIAKNFTDKIKNLFGFPSSKDTIIRDTHGCPLDSAFFVVKKLREMKKLAMERSK